MIPTKPFVPVFLACLFLDKSRLLVSLSFVDPHHALNHSRQNRIWGLLKTFLGKERGSWSAPVCVQPCAGTCTHHPQAVLAGSVGWYTGRCTGRAVSKAALVVWGLVATITRLAVLRKNCYFCFHLPPLSPPLWQWW